MTPLPRRVLSATAALACIALSCSLGVQAEQSTDVKVSAADYATAREAQRVHRHAWHANTPEAQGIGLMELTDKNAAGVAAAATSAAPDSGGPRHPADLQYLGGAVVASMTSHAIYLHPQGGCTIAGCWGNPEGFLRDLGRPG